MSLLEYKTIPAIAQAQRHREPVESAPKTHGESSYPRIRAVDLCRLTEQLAALLRAGMPLVPALSALVEQLHDVSESKLPCLQARHNPVAAVMQQVRDEVNQGSSLSAALAKHPRIFSAVFVNSVAAGESMGNLEDILLRLAQMLKNHIKLLTRVKSAIAYPVVMTVVAVGVVIFLLSYVVPSITQIFIEMNRTLPWPTKLLISVSTFVRSYLFLLLLGICALIAAITAACKTPRGRLFADRIKLNLPLFGRLILKLEIARLTRTLAILLTSGVPILGAMQIVKKVVRNSFIADAVDSIRNRVAKGENIADAMRKTHLFPPIVFHIVATRQAGANLEEGLMNIADMYDSEVEITAKTLTTLLEPAVLLMMGAVVAFIVMAILLPIFEINQAI